jgi:hypothetical protein
MPATDPLENSRLSGEQPITLDVSTRHHVTLTEERPGRTVSLVGAGEAGSEFSIEANECNLARLQLDSCIATHILISGRGSIAQIRIDGVARDAITELAAEDLYCEKLDVHLCTVRIVTPIWGLGHLSIVDGGLMWPRKHDLDGLVIGGHVTVHTAGLRCQKTEVIAGKTGVELLDGRLDFGSILGNPVELSIGGETGATYSLSKIPDHSKLHLDGVALSLLPDPNDVTVALNDLTLVGNGRVRVDRMLRRPCFLATQQGFRLDVRERGELLEARGDVFLVAGKAGLIGGAKTGKGLRIVRIGAIAETELESVNLFDLESVRDVKKLRSCSRVLPWIPWALRARAMQSAQRYSMSDDGKVNWNRNASFWNELDAVLAEKRVPGSVHSRVRVAAVRARRRSLSWKSEFRERALLTCYAAVGYGERILVPLITWTLFNICIAGLIDIFRVVRPHQAYWRLLMMTFAAPLVTFRIPFSRPNSPGIWDTVLFSIAQVVGVALIGLTLLASRRVLRPELGS